MSAEPWIGLVEVKPLPDNDVLGDQMGAFVNVVALVGSREEFGRLVQSTMEEYGFETIEISDVAPLRLWKEQHDVLPDIDELARALTPEYPIQFDQFQSYERLHDA